MFIIRKLIGDMVGNLIVCVVALLIIFGIVIVSLIACGMPDWPVCSVRALLVWQRGQARLKDTRQRQDEPRT